MTGTSQLDPTGGQSSIGGTGGNIRSIDHDSRELHPGGDARPPYFKTPIGRVPAIENSAITRTSDPLNDLNWMAWRERITLTLQLCGVDAYAKGEAVRPDPKDDPEGVDNWTFNDRYAKILITNNITPTQMVHVSRCTTAHDMWVNLEAVHEPRDHYTVMSYMRKLFRTTAVAGTNISEHLNKLKQYWERLNRVGDDDFKFDLDITDFHFKIIISASLPPSWDAFTDSYIGDGPKGFVSSQQLIGILKEEYFRRETRKQEIAVRQASARTRSKLPSDMYCKLGKRRNHNAEDCLHLDKKRKL